MRWESQVAMSRWNEWYILDVLILMQIYDISSRLEIGQNLVGNALSQHYDIDIQQTNQYYLNKCYNKGQFYLFSQQKIPCPTIASECDF